MRQVGSRSEQKHWVLLGMIVVAWAAAWRYRAARQRQWRLVSFLIDEELQSRYLERADPELGTGLFI